MTAGRSEPLVVVISRLPILREALSDSFAGIAEVRHFPAERAELDGLLESIDPDAVVVDGDEAAKTAADFARGSRVPVVHLSLHDQSLRVFDGGSWSVHENASGSAESIANAVLGGIYGRRPES